MLLLQFPVALDKSTCQKAEVRDEHEVPALLRAGAIPSAHTAALTVRTLAWPRYRVARRANTCGWSLECLLVYHNGDYSSHLPCPPRAGTHLHTPPHLPVPQPSIVRLREGHPPVRRHHITHRSTRCPARLSIPTSHTCPIRKTCERNRIRNAFSTRSLSPPPMPPQLMLRCLGEMHRQ